MNILFIGDFHPARNYGSIATTECLFHMLENALSPNDQVRIIDRRSYDRVTPIQGFPQYDAPRHRNIFKSISRRLRCLYKNEKITETDPEILSAINHVPYRFDQFEEYYSQMINGDRLSYEKRLLNWADIVFINGEGTIVNGTDANGIYNRGGRYTIFMAWLSKFKYNKPTCLVNMTVDPGNDDAWQMIRETFGALDFLSVREPLSLYKLRGQQIFNAQYIPDALFSYSQPVGWTHDKQLDTIIDFSKPYIVLGDSTALRKNAYQESVKWDIVIVYKQIICELRKICPQVVFLDGFNGKLKSVNDIIKENNLPYINLSNCDYHNLYYVFSHALMFISGRWHASVLASVANTPVLLYGADSHKTKALYEILEYSFPFFNSETLPIHVKDIIENAKLIIKDNQRIRKQIKVKVDVASAESNRNVEFIQKVVLQPDAVGGGGKSSFMANCYRNTQKSKEAIMQNKNVHNLSLDNL